MEVSQQNIQGKVQEGMNIIEQAQNVQVFDANEQTIQHAEQNNTIDQRVQIPQNTQSQPAQQLSTQTHHLTNQQSDSQPQPQQKIQPNLTQQALLSTQQQPQNSTLPNHTQQPPSQQQPTITETPSTKKITQSSELLSVQTKQETNKKEISKTVEISVKKLKKYVKMETDFQNAKKEIQSIKQQFNKEYQKVAKELNAAKQELDKKSHQLKSINENFQTALNQLKSVQSEVKAKQEKIQKVELQYATLSKKVKQEQKTSQKLTGMQETIKELQKMLDGSTKNQQLYLRQAEKYKEMLRIEKEMNSSLKSQVDQLRHFSSEHFALKQEVGRLLVELKSFRDAKEQYPHMVEKYQHLQHIHEKLKETIKEIEAKNQQNKSIIEKLQKKIDKITEQKKNLQKKVQSTLSQKQERQGQIQAFKMQLEDQRTQIQVQRKRYTSQIKDLKLALHHEHEKLKLTEIQLQQSKKKEKKTVNLQGIKFSSLSKEDLFNLIEQLQMKNASIKINLNALLQDITLKDLKIKDMQNTLMTLTRYIVKALPNLDQSEGMEYVQREIIETGKGKKEDWPEIVEKIVIENLRLKNSVTALGEEFNMRLRAEMEKNAK